MSVRRGASDEPLPGPACRFRRAFAQPTSPFAALSMPPTPPARRTNRPVPAGSLSWRYRVTGYVATYTASIRPYLTSWMPDGSERLAEYWGLSREASALWPFVGVNRRSSHATCAPSASHWARIQNACVVAVRWAGGGTNPHPRPSSPSITHLEDRRTGSDRPSYPRKSAPAHESACRTFQARWW